MPIHKMVLDILLPHEPRITEYAERLSAVDGAERVMVDVIEQDERTKTVAVTIEGDGLEFDAIKDVIEDLGGAIHSIDQVVAGAQTDGPGAPRRGQP